MRQRARKSKSKRGLHVKHPGCKCRCHPKKTPQKLNVPARDWMRKHRAPFVAERAQSAHLILNPLALSLGLVAYYLLEVGLIMLLFVPRLLLSCLFTVLRVIALLPNLPRRILYGYPPAPPAVAPAPGPESAVSRATSSTSLQLAGGKPGGSASSGVPLEDMDRGRDAMTELDEAARHSPLTAGEGGGGRASGPHAHDKTPLSPPLSSLGTSQMDLPLSGRASRASIIPTYDMGELAAEFEFNTLIESIQGVAFISSNQNEVYDTADFIVTEDESEHSTGDEEDQPPVSPPQHNTPKAPSSHHHEKKNINSPEEEEGRRRRHETGTSSEEPSSGHRNKTDPEEEEASRRRHEHKSEGSGAATSPQKHKVDSREEAREQKNEPRTYTEGPGPSSHHKNKKHSHTKKSRERHEPEVTTSEDSRGEEEAKRRHSKKHHTKSRKSTEPCKENVRETQNKSRTRGSLADIFAEFEVGAQDTDLESEGNFQEEEAKRRHPEEKHPSRQETSSERNPDKDDVTKTQKSKPKSDERRTSIPQIILAEIGAQDTDQSSVASAEIAAGDALWGDMFVDSDQEEESIHSHAADI